MSNKPELDKIYDELLILYVKQRNLFNYNVVDEMIEKRISELEQRAKQIMLDERDKTYGL